MREVNIVEIVEFRIFSATCIYLDDKGEPIESFSPVMVIANSKKDAIKRLKKLMLRGYPYSDIERWRFENLTREI